MERPYKAGERGKWMVSGDHLATRAPGGEAEIPSADQIFSAIFESQKPDHDDSTTADTGAPEIRQLVFSQYPIDLEIRLEEAESHGVAKLRCRVFATGEDGEVEVPDILSRKADHIIVANHWFPFVPGALDDIRSVLATAGVKEPGPVSLRQYLELRKLSVRYPFVRDLSGHIGMEPVGTIEISNSFKGTLYPYQLKGLRWLRFICSEGLGGVLADEMGLGKTVQLIALLCNGNSQSRSPSLVIGPGTVLENWRRELAKFAPAIRTVIHQGADRTGFPSELRKSDVVITSYDTLVRDGPLFRQIEWKIVILDEAQAIKNPSTRRTVETKRLNRGVSIAVTGTPVENRLSDLWSIIDFVMPGFLANLSTFERTYSDEHTGASELEPTVSPIILRRRIAEVAKDLPPRIDIPHILSLGPQETHEYEAIRMEAVAQYGAHAGLAALTKLRIFCTHPSLVSDREGDPAEQSEKYRRLLEILEEIFTNGEKALLFTSYTGMIDLLSCDLPKHFSIFCNHIDGRVAVPDRQNIVDNFTREVGPGILLLNPRAAGTGMNITAAAHVVHYNLEWNPAVEDQASARAHRLGQDFPVRIHRLFYASTVEEVIDQRLTHKRQLADAAVVGTRGEEEDYKYIVQALRTSPLLGAKR